MSKLAAKESTKLIVGLGKTGLSCARYFASLGIPFNVTDSRVDPPGLRELLGEFPDLKPELGGFNEESFLAAGELVLSPGVSLKTPAVARAMAAGIPVTGDIDIFSRQVSAPVIAVTGSNGKSTVVSLVAAILSAAGKNFGLGGNLDGEHGRPALDLLREKSREIYLLELSSFQLETTQSLGATVSTILNVTEDHMDRYVSMDAYLLAKQKIFCNARMVVVHQNDPLTRPPAGSDAVWLEYGMEYRGRDGFGVVSDSDSEFIVNNGQRLLAVDQLKLSGQHNIINVLAAMTLAHAAGIKMQAIVSGVTNFAGLPDRCQWVASINGVEFYNDSKGTNVGATLAAVEGLGRKIKGRIILIAGGQGKGADFRPLRPAMEHWVRSVVLIGVDGPLIEAVLDPSLPRQYANSMQDAVELATHSAQTGDVVLLSPACASYDMFQDFRHRGQVFTRAVKELERITEINKAGGLL
ncbi:MAG: UDP-N-acetylmuramoyl-L-alanine--D-glutamate ligase [Pseudohongiellaceae bacterium]